LLSDFSEWIVYVRLSSMFCEDIVLLLLVSLYLLRLERLLSALSTVSLRYARKKARSEGAQLQMMARFHSSSVQK
jgi:hypothetical protein